MKASPDIPITDLFVELNGNVIARTIPHTTTRAVRCTQRGAG